ncbi:MAG: 30S ribosomal protein S6, partial [Candidatus Vogelbacteria bacterium]|nr:30S ribosomal protein S6 [Candidatus Vogelbacteria bacterium]
MDLKSYELGYLLTPLLPEDKVPEAVEQIKSLITGALGEVK